MKEASSVTLDGLWVPHYVAIVDFRDAIHHIQSDPALDVLSKVIGLNRLLNEVMWDGFYGKVSDSMAIFYENQEEIEDATNMTIEDFVKPIRKLEDYLRGEFLEQLSMEKQNAFREEGFTISAWTSATYGVIASTSGREMPYKSPRACAYWNTLDALDVDPRLEDHYQGDRAGRPAPTVTSAPRAKRDRRVSRY